MHPGGLVAILHEGLPSARIRALYSIMLGLVAFLFPFGLVFVAGGVLPPTYSWTASVIIFLNASVTLLSEFRAVRARRALLLFVSLTGVLFVVEYIGVTTGYPFGVYRYPDVLGGSVFGVPVAIVLAWYTTVINSWRIGKALRPRSTLGAALIAGLLTLAMDFALEPMASAVTGYWLWETGRVPVQNYVSWVAFIVFSSVLLSRFYDGEARHTRSLLLSACLVSGSQITLFMVTDILNGHILPVLLSVVVLVIVGLFIPGRDAGKSEGTARI